MSLIFGVNLCDRIYIAADTRLTSMKPSGEVVGFKDKLVKVEILSDDIVLAAAGGASMAAYIIRKLIKNKVGKTDIRSLRKSIESIIAPIAEEYWINYDPKASATFIFGGLNRSQKKVFDRKAVYDKIMAFSKLNESKSSMNLRPALFNCLGEKRYPEPSDSHVFSVQVFPPTGLVVSDADWGSYLAFGPKGINKDSIPEETFGKLEFVGNNNDFSHDQLIITALVKIVAEEKQAQTIGGAVFVSIVSDQITGAMSGKTWRVDLNTNQAEHVSETYVQGGKFYRRDKNGTINRLIPLRDYKDFGSLQI